MSTELVISYDTPQHTCIRCRHPVMYINIQLRKRTDVNAELLIFCDFFRQSIIERMDPLDHDRLTAANRGDPASEFFLSIHKIKFRQIHFFTSQQPVHIIVEQIDIQRIQIFIVRFTVFSERSITAFYEIIIRPHVQWLQPIYPQLHTQPSSKCRLARRRWPGNQNDPPFFFRDPICDLCDLLLMKSL